MVSETETYPEKQPCGGGAALEEGCRIIATTFLSLLPALSFILVARLSITRYLSSVTNNNKQSHEISIMISVFLQSKTTLILSLLVFVVAIAALTHGLTGNKPTFLISQRRRFYAAWIVLFTIQVCLSLRIHGTINLETKNIYTVVGNVVLLRRLVFALGLHEIMVFWRRNVVKPVVDELMFGFSDEGFSWVEKVVLAVAFGNLWWRRLRDEAEALVMLPWVMAVDVLGWLLYYLTVAIGGVRLVRGFSWVVMRIFRHRHQTVKKGDNDTNNSSV